MYYNHKFGFESKVNLIIQVTGIDNIVGELDFATATTDDFEYFKCKVIQNGDQQIINRRRETKVDVMSDLDIDGNWIGKIEPKNMLLLSKPIYQTSKWEQPTAFYENLYSQGNNATTYYIVNPTQLTKSDIGDSYMPFYSFSADSEDFISIKAKTDLKDIKITIKDVLIHLETDVDNGGNGYVDFQLQIRYGKDFNTAKKEVLVSSYLTENQSFDYGGNLSFSIDNLQTEDKIWVIYFLKVRQSASSSFLGLGKFECFTSISGMKVDISAISSSYNSITPTFRLIDVMRQVIKSISGLDIVAPRFDYGGEFYDNRLFNGNFLRNITDKGFKISLEDIEKSLPELNCNYEIANDGRIFFGGEKDFYTPIECGFFDNTQFSSMNKMANPRFTVNEFWFMYKRFQSLKENEEVNSADVIHGESKMTLFNKRVENKKEVSVEWCRDAFLIEENRRKGLEISESTASQNDEDVFIIDSIDTLNDVPFDEVTELQHTFISDVKLSLRTNGDVNFVSMGITVGSIFVIKAPDNNAREYTVNEVSNGEIKIIKNSGAPLGANNDGIRSTSYSYTIDKDYAPYTNYTNQDITAFNLQAAESYSNLRYSIGRNTWNYWKEYIATCNLYWKDKKINNTWYKNNPLCTTVYQGKTIVEGDPFDTSGITPILSPFLYNDIIFANVEFEDFVELQKQIRTKRGFIRCIDKNERVIKVYPIDMKWEVLTKELTIKAEDKYESTYMTINTANAFALINNETRVKNLLWSIEDDKLSVYDANRFRLYNPVYWDKVGVNSATAVTINQLEEWMKLIGTKIN